MASVSVSSAQPAVPHRHRSTREKGMAMPWVVWNDLKNARHVHAVSQKTRLESKRRRNRVRSRKQHFTSFGLDAERSKLRRVDVARVRMPHLEVSLAIDTTRGMEDPLLMNSFPNGTLKSNAFFHLQCAHERCSRNTHTPRISICSSIDLLFFFSFRARVIHSRRRRKCVFTGNTRHRKRCSSSTHWDVS